MIFEVAHQMALLPLVWLAVLSARGQRRGVAWWWLAGAFGVSWLADSAVDLGANADLVGNLYPLTQGALVGAVLLDRRAAVGVAYLFGVVALTAVLWRGPLGIDVLLRTVAWGTVAGVAWPFRALGKVRTALLVSFGLGWAVWLWYAAVPGWPSWLTYQAVRAAGLACFCWAALDPRPALVVSR